MVTVVTGRRGYREKTVRLGNVCGDGRRESREEWDETEVEGRGPTPVVVGVTWEECDEVWDETINIERVSFYFFSVP